MAARPFVHWQNSGALRKRLKDIAADVQPGSGKMKRFQTALTKAVTKDNTEKLLGYGSSAWAGVDRFGKDLAQPADSTIRSWGHLGRVLAPHGTGSRAITRFKVRWLFDGAQMQMVAGWVGITWMIYHLRGCPKGSKGVDKLGRDMANWSLPRRDIGGISPKGWVDVRAEFSKLARSILKAKGS
jgi:hypothetical protein